MPRPYPDIKMIEKVKTFRTKGLSFVQIAKLLDKDVKTIYRWHSYSIGKLSTDKQLTIGKKRLRLKQEH